jgi:hypothetical protein
MCEINSVRMLQTFPFDNHQAHFFLQNYDEAHAAYSRARELAPNDELVAQALANVIEEQVSCTLTHWHTHTLVHEDTHTHTNEHLTHSSSHT